MPRLLLLATLAPTVLSAQSDPVLESRRHAQAAARAYEARDLPAFLKHAREAQALRPTHGGATLALASALALTGDTAGAFGALRHFAALGYSADVASDSAFVRLRGGEAFADIERRLARNKEPVVRGRVALELADSALLAEGVAYDSRDRTFYVTSVGRGKIVRVTRDGGVSDFALVEGGRWAPLGLRVDERRRTLWVATAALPQTAAYTPADSGRSAIVRYDLRTGRLVRRYEVPPDGNPHLLGDLIVSRAGVVYATDSRAPLVYRIGAGSERLEVFVRSRLFLAAQGLALAPDERTLYVADYARGLLRVDLGSRVVSEMKTADGVLTLGIDGLYLHEGSLIGIQNGVAPHRVVRFTLDPAGERVVRSDVLERAHPRHDEPTLGVVSDGELYYVANSQWGRFGDGGRIEHPDSLRRPVVLRLPL